MYFNIFKIMPFSINVDNSIDYNLVAYSHKISCICKIQLFPHVNKNLMCCLNIKYIYYL